MNYIKNEEGTTAVEFALISGVFFVLVLGIMEAGRALWSYNAVEYAIESASRYALVNEDATEEEIIDVAEQKLSNMKVSPEDLSAIVSVVSDGSMDFLEIDATYSYESLVSVLLPVSIQSYDMNLSTVRPLVWGDE